MKNYKSFKRDAKENDGQTASRDEIITQARKFLKLGGLEARREIVRTLLELDRLLGNN